MDELWREWVTENPFVRQELRRSGRRRLTVKLIAWTVGLCAAAVLGVHAVVHWIGGDTEQWLRAHGGAVLWSITSAVHAVMFLIGLAATTSLGGDAAAGRLELLQLLPMGRRELLAKLTLSRAVLRAPLALAPAPIHLVAFWYGGIDIRDGIYLVLVLLALVFSPPGPMEMTNALRPRTGTPAAQAAAGNRAAGVSWIASFGLIQLAAQFLARRVLGPLVMGVFNWTARVVGPQLGLLLPLSLVAVGARFVGETQPLFRGSATPLLLLLLYWPIGWWSSLVRAADYWSREAATRRLPTGQVLAVLPAGSAHPTERRAGERLEQLSSGLGFLLIAAWLWKPAILTGRLAGILGDNSPEGGVAALFLIALLPRLLGSFERLRGEPYAVVSTPRPLKTISIELAKAAGRLLVLLALACLFGWLLPGSVLARTVALAFGLGASLLLFGAGWAAVASWRRRRLKAAGRPDAGFPVFLWLLTYVGPLALLAFPQLPPAYHLAGLWSPIYALCAAFPGAWAAPSPYPVWMSATVSAGVGVLLLVAFPRKQEASRAAEREPTRDPLAWRLIRAVERMDNPILTRASQRLVQTGWSPSFQLAGSLLGGVLAPAAFVILIAGGPGFGNWPQIIRFLANPTPVTGIRAGAFVGLISSALLLLCSIGGLLLQTHTAAVTERVMFRHGGRSLDLLLSPQSERNLMEGTILSALTNQTGATAGMALASAAWLLFALFYRAGWGWLVLWIGGLALGVLLGGHLVLEGFFHWPRRHWGYHLSSSTYQMVLTLGVPMAATIAMACWVFLPDYRAHIELGTWLTCLMIGGAAALTLRAAARRAERAVRLCRMPESLERVLGGK